MNEEQTPVEEVKVTPEEVDAPVEPEVESSVEETPEVPAELVVETPEEPVAPVVDRSAYNCPDCKGEGLVLDDKGVQVRCGKCGGTGKV